MPDIERPQDRQITTQDIALMARELVLVTLPHKDPGDVPRWSRQNGNITLAIQPGYKSDPDDRRQSVCIGYPYGSIARLILYWIVTEARRTGNPRLVLGKSLTDFMRKLGLHPNYGGGPRSSTTGIQRQLERLLYARITFEQSTEERARGSRQWFDMPVAKGGALWWDTETVEERAMWGGFVVLNDDFFRAIITQPVPVRMMALLALKKSPLGLDLYAWATLESYKAQHHGHGRFVAWSLLHEQFGTEVGRLDNFIAKAKREFQKILLNCPSLRLACVRGGVQILAESLPDVPTLAAQNILEPPRPTLKIPSSVALEQVRSLDTRESAVMIAVAFLKAVERGAAELTDEAYLTFAQQYV
jgi:hypothetical protein